VIQFFIYLVKFFKNMVAIQYFLYLIFFSIWSSSNLFRDVRTSRHPMSRLDIQCLCSLFSRTSYDIQFFVIYYKITFFTCLRGHPPIRLRCSLAPSAVHLPAFLFALLSSYRPVRPICFI